MAMKNAFSERSATVCRASNFNIAAIIIKGDSFSSKIIIIDVDVDG